MYVTEVSLAEGPYRLRGWIVAYLDKLLKKRTTPQGVTVVDWDTYKKLVAMAFVQDDQAWDVLTKFTWLVNRMSHWSRVARLAGKHKERVLEKHADALRDLAKECVRRGSDAWAKSLKAKKFREQIVRMVKGNPTIAFTDEVWSTIRDTSGVSLFMLVPMYNQIKAWRKAAYAYEHGGPFRVPQLGSPIALGWVLVIVVAIVAAGTSVWKLLDYLESKLRAEEKKRIETAINETAQLLLRRKEAATVEEAHKKAEQIVKGMRKVAEELAPRKTELGAILSLAGAAVGVFLVAEIIGLFKKSRGKE